MTNDLDVGSRVTVFSLDMFNGRTGVVQEIAVNAFYTVLLDGDSVPSLISPTDLVSERSQAMQRNMWKYGYGLDCGPD